MIGIYFSGTGNTKYCIEKFLEECGDDIKSYSIEDEKAVSEIKNHEKIVIAYPVYYSNIPKILSDFIKNNSTIWQDKEVFIVATMGLFSGDGAGILARLLKSFGAKILGGLHLKMPDCISDVKLLKRTLDENKEIVIIREGIEYSKYENIPVAVQKKYEEYLEKVKSYGIKVQNKDFYINSLTQKEEVYGKKLLDLNKLKELEASGMRRIIVENSIVTSSAEEYAKEKNIEIIKRR